MSQQIEYSSLPISKAFRRETQRTGIGAHYTGLSRWLLSIKDEVETNAKIDLSRTSRAVAADAMILHTFATTRHIFCAPGLHDFCVNAAREDSDSFMASEFPEYPCEWPFGYSSKSHVLADGFFVHFPSDEGRLSKIIFPGWRSMTVSLCPIWAAECTVVNDDLAQCLIFQRNQQYDCEDPEPELVERRKFVRGLSLYLDAFPDALIPALRDQVANRDHYGCHGKVATLSKDAKHEIEGMKCPHFRRGHFKTLRSAFYKQSHGKTIWTRGCFINMEAKDAI